MPSVATLLDDERLVPGARFGAALHRTRSRSGASLAGLARASDGRYLPDQLVAIERGAVVLDDRAVAELADLYELPQRPWPQPSSLLVVLDRAAASEFVAPGEPSRAVSSDAWIAARFVALSVLLGAGLTSGSLGIDALADGLDRSVDETVDLVSRALENDADRVRSMVAAMEHRVVVPEVGFLVGETTCGTLIVVGRGPRDPDCSFSVVHGRLGDVLDSARS